MTEVFRASKWRQLSEYWVVPLFLGLTGVAFWQWIAGNGTAYQNLMALIWPVMLCLSVYLLTRFVHTVEFMQGGMKLHSLIRSELLQDPQITVVNLSPRTGYARIVASNGKEYPLILRSFSQEQTLVQRLDERYGHLVLKAGKQALESSRIYRQNTAARVLIGLSVFCTVLLVAAYLGDPSALPLILLALSIVLVLLWLGMISLKNFTQVSRQGITVRHFGATKTVEWHDVQSVEFTLQRNSNTEVMLIKGRKDEVAVTVGDDTSLRAAILLSVPEGKVKDSAR